MVVECVWYGLLKNCVLEKNFMINVLEIFCIENIFVCYIFDWSIIMYVF